MKKVIKSIFLLLLVSCLAACSRAAVGEGGNEKESNGAIAEFKDENFVYRLYKEKAEYHEGDSVKLIAELEYVGDRDSVTISHEASPFYFLISENSGRYGFMYMMDQPLLHTTLERGKPLVEEYVGGGAYLVENGLANWEKPSDNPFPAGKYTVQGYAKFVIEGSGKEGEDPFQIGAELIFEVQP